VTTTPATGGLGTALRAAERDGLAGDDLGRVTVLAPVLVEDPAHRLGVRAHVRRRDVPARSEHRGDLVGVAPGEAFEFGGAELVRGDLDPALGAAEREVDEGGLPRHQRGERPYLVDVGVRVVTDAALVRTSGAVVLDAVAVAHHP
jgi:hypothetical protein